MTINDFLNRMALMGVGIVPPSDKDKNDFLIYLNMAHEELYPLVSVSLLPFIGQTSDFTTSEEGTLFFDPFPFTIEEIINIETNRPITFESEKTLRQTDILLTRVGAPIHWFMRQSVIYLYPNPQSAYTITMTFIPNIQPLTLLTPESQIPYPLAFHRVLLEGAFYYLFQGESGFKNVQKMNMAQMKWEKGKAKMINYLDRFQGNLISTYSH